MTTSMTMMMLHLNGRAHNNSLRSATAHRHPKEDKRSQGYRRTSQASNQRN